MIAYVVEKYSVYKDDWYVIGVFTTKTKAVEACKKANEQLIELYADKEDYIRVNRVQLDKYYEGPQ